MRRQCTNKEEKMEKKLLVLILSAVALCAVAQDVQEQEAPRQLPVDLSADLGLYSAYVWRGQIVNDHAVLQPSVTASKGPFSFNIWGNWNLDQPAGRDDDLEIDYTAAYTLPINSDDVSVDVGSSITASRAADRMRIPLPKSSRP
jgi:hypothetical protein